MADETTPKPITTTDLRSKGDAELSELLKSTEKTLFEARFQNYTNRLNDTSKLGKLRREVARIRTIIHERMRSAKKAAAVTTTKSEG